MWNKLARNTKKIKIFYKLTKNKTKNLGNNYIGKIKQIQNTEKYQQYKLRMEQIRKEKYQRYITQMQKLKQTPKYKKYEKNLKTIKQKLKKNRKYLLKLSEKLKLRKKKKKVDPSLKIKTLPIYRWKENYIYEKNIQKYKIFQGSAYLILLKKLILPSTLILAHQYFLAILPSISFLLSFAFFYNFQAIVKRGISDISFEPINEVLVFKNFDARFEIGKNDFVKPKIFFNKFFLFEFESKKYYVLNFDRVRNIDNNQAYSAILCGDFEEIKKLFKK